MTAFGPLAEFDLHKVSGANSTGHRHRPVVTGSSKTKGGPRLDEEKIELPGAKEAEVPGFDARPLTRSALGLANDVRLRKSSTVEAGHPVDVG